MPQIFELLKGIPIAIMIITNIVVIFLIFGFSRIIDSIILGITLFGYVFYYLHYPWWMSLLFGIGLFTVTLIFSKFRIIFLISAAATSFGWVWIQQLLVEELFPFSVLAKIIFIAIGIALYIFIHIKGYEQLNSKNVFTKKHIYEKGEREFWEAVKYYREGLKIEDLLKNNHEAVSEKDYIDMKTSFLMSHRLGYEEAIIKLEYYNKFSSLKEYLQFMGLADDNCSHNNNSSQKEESAGEEYNDELTKAKILFMIDDLESIDIDYLKKQRNLLIKTYHSDNSIVNTDDYSKKINEAYNVLKEYIESD